MNTVVSYSNKKFRNSQLHLDDSLLKTSHNISHFKYVEENLPNWFINKNKFHFNSRRGGGYWVWKPYIILEKLLSANDGDWVMYVDSGMSVIQDINILFDYFNDCDEDVILFQNHGLQNQVWTKRDCFYLMNCDNERFYFKDQINAAIQLYKKTDKSINFLKDYLQYCENFQIINDINNIYREDFPSFKEHRHDQSVLTNLAYLHSVPLFRNPTQFGNHLMEEKFVCDTTVFSYGVDKFDKSFPNSSYPQIFNHHRRRFNYKASYLKNISLKLYRAFK